MSTPHNSAVLGDFAPTVLMPGDPLRSKFIAETYLDHLKLVNNVRGVQGYTGEYKGKPVSVMASGMGIPSIAIYSYELFSEYGVENVIRVGSAGMLSRRLQLRSVVAAMSAYSDSGFGGQFGFQGSMAPCCDFALLEKAVAAARKMGVEMAVGPVFSGDSFYDAKTPTANEILAGLGVLAVEMETYGLYLTAARMGKKALTLLTVSDDPLTGTGLGAQERQTSFTQMMEIALETA